MISEIIAFLTAGAFVYAGLKVKMGFGDVAYYVLVVLMLIIGIVISKVRGV